MPRQPRTVYYIGLRLLNSVMGIAWGFALTSVMVRVVGIDEYARYVLIGAIGLYLASVDLGISNLVYARLREKFLAGEAASVAAPIRGAVAIYFGVALLSVPVYAAVAAAQSVQGGGDFVAPMLFFIATVVNLPWTVLRSVCGALERQFNYEAIDFLRRGSQLAIIACLVAGLNLAVAFLVLDIIWLSSLFIILRPLRSPRFLNLGFSPRTIWQDLQAFISYFGQDAKHSSIFVLSEAFSYNFPYLALPLLFGANASVVLFDVFSKFFRAAILANQVASIGLLPQVSRAYFTGDTRRLITVMLGVLCLSMLAMTSLVLILMLAHDIIFRTLLHDQAALVTPAMIAAIAIVAFANAVQNTAGSFIVNVGLVKTARLLALIVAGVLLLTTIVEAVLGVSFDVFMLCYSVIYAVGAIGWGAFAYRIILTKPYQEFPTDLAGRA